MQKVNVFFSNKKTIYEQRINRQVYIYIYIYIVLRYVIKPHLKMNKHNVHLLDLPNEIEFLILFKLDNINVLYSSMGINNQRLIDVIA